MGLDELGTRHVGPSCDERGIEALHVSDLERHAGAGGGGAHGLGLLERRGHRLLHQDVPLPARGPLHGRAVGHGRRRDRDRLAGIEQGLGRRKHARPVALRHICRARRVAVVDAHQLGLRKRVEHAGVLLAPRADAPHADSQRRPRWPSGIHGALSA